MPVRCLAAPAQVLEAGGSELAVAITAASLALADAGIELTDLVAACSMVSWVGWGEAPGATGNGG